MARVRKPQITLESLFFSTPEQKVLRLLLSEPTTAFSLRTISSKLKGVRGLGGGEGIKKILGDLETLGMIDFVDNHRAVRIRDDNSTVRVLKSFAAICDLESLVKLLEPIASRGILFGSRATGRARSDSDYDLFVVSDSEVDVKHIAGRHPLGKSIELVVWKAEDFERIEQTDPGLHQKLLAGIMVWGSDW